MFVYQNTTATHTDGRFDPVISTIKVVIDALGFLLHGLVAM